MSQLTPNFQHIPTEEMDHTTRKVHTWSKKLSTFGSMLQSMWQNLAYIINGQLGFGDGVHSDNINGVWVSVTFAAPNVDQLITHNLGRIPVGYIPMTKSAACDVYNGSVGATKTQITLRGTTTSTVLLFII